MKQPQKKGQLGIRIIRLQKLRTHFLDNKVRPLFVSLVLLLVLYPFFGGDTASSVLLSVLISVLLLSGVSALSRDRKRFSVSLLIAIPTLAATWGDVLMPGWWMRVANLGLTILFTAYLTGTVLWYVLRAKQITIDEIFGAICVYLLLGLVWANLFGFVETVAPGSFSVNPARYGERAIVWADFLYYSFVTLTTTGYGDITPITANAQSLAILESVFGVLYVAVLVARLVGLYNPQPALPKPKMRDFKLDEFIKEG